MAGLAKWKWKGKWGVLNQALEREKGTDLFLSESWMNSVKNPLSIDPIDFNIDARRKHASD